MVPPGMLLSVELLCIDMFNGASAFDKPLDTPGSVTTSLEDMAGMFLRRFSF